MLAPYRLSILVFFSFLEAFRKNCEKFLLGVPLNSRRVWAVEYKNPSCCQPLISIPVGFYGIGEDNGIEPPSGNPGNHARNTNTTIHNSTYPLPIQLKRLTQMQEEQKSIVGSELKKLVLESLETQEHNRWFEKIWQWVLWGQTDTDWIRIQRRPWIRSRIN
jgi:hypothetical protein